MKALHSLQTKLTLSFVILILIVTSLTFLHTYRETKVALKEITQVELVALSSVIASQLHGETAEVLRDLKPGDETSPMFHRISERLLAIRASHPDIRYVYTMKQVEGNVVFMVDPDFGNKEDPGAAIGEIYSTQATGNLLRGFEAPTVDDVFTTDRWGTFLSGYAPLYDTQGAVVGIVGVDMAQDRVQEKQVFIGNTIYAVMGVGIVVAALFILLFSKTIIKDVHKLNEVANRISMGQMDVHIDVVRKDELGDLADSFGRMVASLKIMMIPKND